MSEAPRPYCFGTWSHRSASSRAEHCCDDCPYAPGCSAASASTETQKVVQPRMRAVIRGLVVAVLYLSAVVLAVAGGLDMARDATRWQGLALAACGALLCATATAIVTHRRQP
jgi:hypothetical protein